MFPGPHHLIGMTGSTGRGSTGRGTTCRGSTGRGSTAVHEHRQMLRGMAKHLCYRSTGSRNGSLAIGLAGGSGSVASLHHHLVVVACLLWCMKIVFARYSLNFQKFKSLVFTNVYFDVAVGINVGCVGSLSRFCCMPCLQYLYCSFSYSH